MEFTNLIALMICTSLATQLTLSSFWAERGIREMQQIRQKFFSNPKMATNQYCLTTTNNHCHIEIFINEHQKKIPLCDSQNLTIDGPLAERWYDISYICDHDPILSLFRPLTMKIKR